jgi:RNA polymerase sigma-70 factor (ECF subfamily)
MSPNDFKALFEQHAGFVWRVLQRHRVPRRDIEDGCQEVFLVLFRRWAEFEGRSSVRTWLYGIAVRVALGMRRRAHFRRELLTEQVPEGVAPGDGFDDSLQREASQLLTAALAALARPKREVFALYELEDMTMAEVSSALGIAENTALYRLYAARDEILGFVRKQELLATARSARPDARPRDWVNRLKKGGVS